MPLTTFRPFQRRFAVHFSSGLLLCSLAFIILGGISLRADNRLLALVGGDSPGQSEIKSILQNVILAERPAVQHEEQMRFLEASAFARYRMVVIAGRAERAYSAEESQVIEEYIKGGGKLLLIHEAPLSFPATTAESGHNEAFFFGRSYYRRDNPLCEILRPKDPVLSGALQGNNSPFWLHGVILLKNPEWDNLIGSGDLILVGRRKMERGEVYFLGHELFRLMANASKEGKGEDVEGWRQILKNILSES